MLHGRTALVIGGTSGIGLACADALARAGARVLIAGRRDDGEEIARGLRAQGSEASFHRVDVTDAASVDALGATVRERFGGLDIAVNSLASAEKGVRLAEETIAHFDAVFAVNVRGLWLAMQMEIKQMLMQETGGTIVNIGSMAAFSGTLGGGFYAASKHAVEGLSKTASNEYAGNGIRVNSVAPGPTRTPLLERAAGAAALEAIGRARPMGRVAEPSEVAEAVLFLASDGARYITGETICMDGGARHLPRIGIPQ